MKTFRWLHVTDLHWGSDDHKDLWGSIQPHWFNDIDRLQQKCGGPWDAVFFTGDLVNRGTKEEFTALTEQLHDLFKHLKSKGSEPYLMVVPGNHDLQRPDAKSAGCKLLTKLWADDEDTQNAIWRKDTSSDAWKVVQKAFKNFTSWYAQVAKPFNIPSGITPGLLPGEFAVTLEKGTYKIGVLGLNTAFLQLAEGDFKGKLETHAAQMVAACGEQHQQWVEKHDTCLLLTHHPVDWLSKQGQSAFNGVIAPSGRFVLHLCGHNHEAAMLEMMMGGATSSRRLLCGRAIFGMDPYTDWVGKSQKARTHGYSAGSIDFSPPQPVLRIWPRRMDIKGDGVWGFNQDTYFHLDENEAIKPVTFDSPRQHQPILMTVATGSPTSPAPVATRADRDPKPPETEIQRVVKNNICQMLDKKKSLKCFRAVLQGLLAIKKEAGHETGPMVDTLLAMDLIEAIIQLQLAVRECMATLKDDGKDINELTLTWDDCVSILGWLVLVGVKEEWAGKMALALAERGNALDLMVPVETEVGLDIVVSRLNQVKAQFNLDVKSMNIIAPARIASEQWQIEMGWSLEEKLLTVKKQLWKQLNRLDPAMVVDKSDEKLTRELKQMLHSRRRMGENHYMVLNLPNKSSPYLEEEVYRQLVAELQNLDIFYLVNDSDEGLAIVAETELQTQIREFLYIKTTIKEG